MYDSKLLMSGGEVIIGFSKCIHASDANIVREIRTAINILLGFGHF